LAQLQQLGAQVGEKDSKLEALITDKSALDAELQRLRAEIFATCSKNETEQKREHHQSRLQP
jgi:type I restriction enzyme, R subunit